MDAKALDFFLLAALSLFCSIITSAMDRDFLSSGFFVLCLIAMWSAALPSRR